MRVKPAPAALASHLGTTLNPSCTASNIAPKMWGSATHMTDLEVAPDTCLQPGLAPGIAAIWGMNLWIEDPYLSVC